MQHLFEYDITKGHDSEQSLLPADLFLYKRVSESHEDALEDHSETMDDIEKLVSLPTPLNSSYVHLSISS